MLKSSSYFFLTSVMTVFIFNIIFAKRNFDSTLTKFDCETYDESYFADVNCSIVNRTIDNVRHKMGAYKVRFMRMTPTLSISIEVKRSDLTLFHIELNLCNALLGNVNRSYKHFLRQMVRQSLDELPKCPLKESFLLGQYLFLGSKMFPVFALPGNYDATITYSDLGIKRMAFFVEVEIVRV